MGAGLLLTRVLTWISCECEEKAPASSFSTRIGVTHAFFVPRPATSVERRIDSSRRQKKIICDATDRASRWLGRTSQSRQHQGIAQRHHNSASLPRKEE